MLYLARLLAGVTQHELARSTGMKQETLSGYERGLRTPKLAAAMRLAVELDVPLDLIGREIELVALDLPARMSATAGQVVAVVRIAPTMTTAEAEEAAFTTNAASGEHHDPANSRHASLPAP
jgi:transcriptional regulator with XRE-family HTH domain